MNISSEGKDCSSKCLLTSCCTHYTWSKINETIGICSVKLGNVTKLDAVYEGQGYVCGLVYTLGTRPCSFNGCINF